MSKIFLLSTALIRCAKNYNSLRQASVWEGVASGYWTQPVKLSSGFISH